MRAKITTVAFVVCGLFGAVALAAPSGQAQLASRDHPSGGHHDDAPTCIAEEDTVVGPVCVSVEDVNVLSS